MRNTPNAVMIFAAGFGTRMKALTVDRPKPLIEVAGKPLIDYALDLVDAAAIPNCVANVHYKPTALVAHLEARGVKVSYEASRILETGGGLKHARSLLPDGPVFTMNSDVVFRGPNPFEALCAVWNPAKMDALLLLVPVCSAFATSSTGDFDIDDEGTLSRGAGLIYTGLQILKLNTLTDIEQEVFSLNLVWDRLQAQGRLFGTSYSGKWCDVGHPEGIAVAEALLEAPDV